MEVIDAKQIVKKSQFNIISKNYPLKPEEIKKKYSLKDGGKLSYFYTIQKRKNYTKISIKMLPKKIGFLNFGQSKIKIRIVCLLIQTK
jgi:hypothetical protein